MLWCSGRRNLGDASVGGSGALLRLKLRPRQDAVSTVLAVAEGLPDQLEITLPLPGGGGGTNGVPVALAVGRPVAVKEAVEDFGDLRRLTKAIAPNGAPVKNLPWWPSAVAPDPDSGPSLSSGSAGGLAAVADSVQAFADLVAAGPMGPALAASTRASLASSSTGKAAVLLSPKPRLRLLRLSGDGALRTRGAGNAILTAVVDLPALGARDGDGMEDVLRIVAAVLATADAVAVYGGKAAAGTPAGGKVMGAEARNKALALRAAASKAVAAGEEVSGGGSGCGSNSSSQIAARNLEAKRLAAREAEKAKLASMSNEAKEKYLLKKQRIEQKRLMKRRTVRG